MSDNQKKHLLSRRSFIKMSGTLTAAGALFTDFMNRPLYGHYTQDLIPKIKRCKKLGRTAFNVSDISMGGTRCKDPNVYRYAYDSGINYFDSAEGYQNGDSERSLGQALKYMDRSKIFITTKLPLSEDESENSIVERFYKCLDRLQTNYVDALYMHSVKSIDLLNKKEFHSATDKLKADGKIRFIGISSHGPSRKSQNSMEEVMTAAALDDRFDLLLFIYNFMNSDVGDKIVEACKQKNVGTTAMKTAPGILKAADFDPLNPTEEQQRRLARLRRRYDDENEIREKMEEWVNRQKKTQQQTQSFIDRYGAKTDEQLRLNSIRWVIQNQDIHTACISFRDFDLIDKLVPYSGSSLSEMDSGQLINFQENYDDQYCRHGCIQCMDVCPDNIPVSKIMRYAYYFEQQGREKEAIEKYKRLSGHNVLHCRHCSAPCLKSCQYNIDIPEQLTAAHHLLSTT